MFKKQTKLNYSLNNPLSFRKDDGEDMHIRFKNGNGTEHTYPDVLPEVAKKFSMATSYGKAFNQDIKPYSVNA